MGIPEPIYSPQTCLNPAYQLNWSFDLFWHDAPVEPSWLEQLTNACEVDGIRILNHRFSNPSISQFLISTRPSVQPLSVAKKIKGRLQTYIREDKPNAFQRNYCIRSLGSSDRGTINNYVSSQLRHHPMADKQVEERFKEFQLCDSDVDLREPSHTSHAIYWYNLHVVLVNSSRYREIGTEKTRARFNMIRNVTKKKGYLLHQIGLLPDHVHLTLRAELKDTPAEIAFSFLNNLAFQSGMVAEYCFSYYVGTFGEYTLNAIPREE